jgi:hypothetical protein
MKERPILFSGPLVRAILDGRKTQTRRVVKTTDSGRVKAAGSAKNWHLDDPNAVLACPYGVPGDRLWVRETWSAIPVYEVDNGVYEAGEPYHKVPKEKPSNAHVIYAADTDAEGPFRPSIHMPRWASRILLEVDSVRVERLNDISELDAKAEGCFPRETEDGWLSCRTAFCELWEAINGPDSWDANPWVWVVEFGRVLEGESNPVD